MAEILSFLKQSAKAETKTQSIIRPNESDYQFHNEDFRLPTGQAKIEGGVMQQYCSVYFKRLEALKPALREAAELRWDEGDKAQYVDNILDLNPLSLTVIIGTLFKDQNKKPNVFADIQGVIASHYQSGDERPHIGMYVDEEKDYAVLEDVSGRIQITKSEVFQPSKFVTGSIVALLGQADQNGFFVVQDFCYGGVPFKPELPKHINLSLQPRSLFDKGLLSAPSKRNFVAFVSGFCFGGIGDSQQAQNALFAMRNFIRGEHPSEQWNQLSAQIRRLVICGDSIKENEKSDQVCRGSYKTQNINKEVYAEIHETQDRLEDYLASLLDTIDVDLMPGAQDFSNAYLPQQPINAFMFPKLADKVTLNLVTNPHKFSAFKGIDFLGTSGQNLHNISQYSNLDDSTGLGLLNTTLELRHLCPTAPDTLRTFPFREEDPFVIEHAPDVYFAGCQESYQERMVVQKGANQAVKLISVPVFAQSFSIVLLDIESFESYEVKFG